jgi:hypothetical protein
MSTIYPIGIDTNIELPTVVDNLTPVKATTVNILRDAIIAIEAELGVKPSETYGTVLARLDAITAALGSIDAVQQSGTPLGGGPFNTLNFSGTGVSVSNGPAGTAHITITGIGTIAVVEQSGVPLSGAPFNTLNFSGSGVSVSNGPAGVADIVITGGGGGGTFGGDLATNTPTTQTVIGLQNRPVASTAPSVGQELTWNGTHWAPATNSGSPAGVTGDIQINESGSFGVDTSNFTYDTTNHNLVAIDTGGPTNTIRSGATQNVIFGSSNVIGVGVGFSAAIGSSNAISTSWSFTFGRGNSAGGLFSLTVGVNNSTTGQAAVALGEGCTAGGEASVAIGNTNTSSALAAITIGENCNATMEAAIALGSSCSATAVEAVALGGGSTASGRAALATGLFGAAASYGERCHNSQTNTGGYHDILLFNTDSTGSGATLNQGDGTAFITLADTKSYSIRVDVIGSRTDAQTNARWSYEIAAHTTGGQLFIDDVLTVRNFPNGTAWTVMIAAVASSTNLQITGTGTAAQTVNFQAYVAWHQIGGF